MRLGARALGLEATIDTIDGRARVDQSERLVSEGRWERGQLAGCGEVPAQARQALAAGLRSAEQAASKDIAAEDAALVKEARESVLASPGERSGLFNARDGHEVIVNLMRRETGLELTVEAMGPLVDMGDRAPRLLISELWGFLMRALSLRWQEAPGTGVGEREGRRCAFITMRPRARRGPVQRWNGPTRERQQPPRAATGQEDPYQTLGTSPSATNAEVKSAYLDKIKLNHPDKVAHLSEAIQAVAHEETLAINRAYASIQRLRSR